MALALEPKPCDKYITARQVCERYSFSDMSLWRTIHDPDKAFPQPMRMNRRRLFCLRELEAWDIGRREKAV